MLKVSKTTYSVLKPVYSANILHNLQQQKSSETMCIMFCEKYTLKR